MTEKEKLARLVLKETEEFNCCIQTKSKEYKAKEHIMRYESTKISQMGILLEGNAVLYVIDNDGNRNILEYLEAGSIFGEMFVLSGEQFYFEVEAMTACKVMYLKYDFLVHRCGNNCQHHAVILSNLFHIIALKNNEMRMHLDILSRRSIRNKLLTYFSYMGLHEEHPEITLPVSWTDLADYLCVERASMMREVKNMSRDGLIATEGRRIQYL